MLDNLMSLVKGTVQSAITENKDIPQAKKKLAASTATEALTSSLKNNLDLGSLTEIAGMFGSGSKTPSTSSLMKNPLISGIINNVVSSLISKVGLSKTVANSAASSIVPMVLSMISSKISDPKEKGFNLESVLGSLTGGSGSSSAGNILGSLGKLFGK